MTVAASRANDGTALASDALVVFGFTGDLAYKKVLPALYSMVKKGTLAVPVIGVASRSLDTDKLHERVRGSIESVHRGQWDAARALGLSPWRVLRLVILPQALKPMMANGTASSRRVTIGMAFSWALQMDAGELRENPVRKRKPLIHGDARPQLRQPCGCNPDICHTW